MQIYLQHMKAVIPTHNQTAEDQFSAIYRDILGGEAEFNITYLGEDHQECDIERQQLVCELASEIESILNHHDATDLLGDYARKSIAHLGGKVVSKTHIILRNSFQVKVELKIDDTEPNNLVLFMRATSLDYDAAVSLETNDFLAVMTAADMITLSQSK